MNYVLFCDRSEMKAYKEMFRKNAADSNLLAAESVINNETVDRLKTEYNPHGVVIASSGTEQQKIVETVKYARERYDDMRIVIIYPGLEPEYAQEMKKYTSDVITRAITAEDFSYLVNNRLTEYDIGIINDKVVKKAAKQSFSFSINKKALIIIFAVLFVAFLIFGIVYKSTVQGGSRPSSNRKPEQVETETESGLDNPTENETESEDKPETEASESITELTRTQPTTAEATERPTQKPTEKATKTTKPKNTEPTQSHTQNPVQSQPQQQQQKQQQQQQSQPRPQPQTDPIYSAPETEPQYTPTSPPIVDDGRIYLDPTEITVKPGQSFDIYVSGLSAANGCNWNVQNAAVVDFVSGDTTKVILRAKGIGVTIVTATAKSSGYSVQCRVTVKK